MTQSIRRWLVFSLVCLSALAGCADDDAVSTGGTSSGGAAGSGGAPGGQGGTAGSGGSAGSGAVGGCTLLTPLDTSMFFGSAAFFALSARTNAPVAGYAKTRLELELYDEGSGLPTGTFDLSKTPDDSYATCEHCVLLVAYDEVGQARRVWFQNSGSMVLEKLAAEEHAGVGSVSSVKLVEVTQDLDASWHEVPGGSCFELPSWSFDTTPVNGGDCDSAEDCPNDDVQVCDVETKKCVSPECSLTFDPPFCNAGQLCLSQIGALIERDEGGSAAGACYKQCTPGAKSSCGAGKTCFPLGPTQAVGVCLSTGGAAVGEPCTPSDLATGCAEGAFCAGDPPRCQKACDYLSPPGGCPSGTYCSQLNLCEPLAVGDLATVGTECAPASPTQRDCGPEGDMFRGLCIDWYPEVPSKTCERICKLDKPACGPNQTCVPMFTNPAIGVCHTQPTCGDQVLDLIGGEVCDDGNQSSGDGCSADCKTAELDKLCSKAEPLVMGVAFDTNAKGSTGYASTCDPYVANPSKLYSFLPSAPGKLTLELESAANLGISVLADCANATSELACKEKPGKDTLHLNFASVPAEPVLVTVRGTYPLATGSFALSASFVPAVCGDAQVGGAEVCDDGNQASNDGCSSDCSTIEWAAVCDSLAPLPLDSKVQGNVDGGTLYFGTSGFCAYESGRERAYSFTASTAGTLELTMSSPGNLTLAVLDGCGPVDPTKLLSCANSGFAGETETLGMPVTAGQKVTVVVQAHTTEDGGAYQLEAKLVP